MIQYAAAVTRRTSPWWIAGAVAVATACSFQAAGLDPDGAPASDAPTIRDDAALGSGSGSGSTHGSGSGSSGSGSSGSGSSGSGSGSSGSGSGSSGSGSGSGSGSACNATGLTCLGHVTVTTCNGGCWVTCDDTVTEPGAALRCGGWGGKVAPIRTAADQTCATVGGEPSWTGLVQRLGASSPTEGWSWNNDNVAPTFLAWASGQPEDHDGHENNQENCAIQTPPSRAWSDVGCLARYPFACRR